MLRQSRRAASARGLCAAAAIALVATAAPLYAHNPLLGEFTCPLCQKSHVDEFLGPQPFYLISAALGIGPELRSWSYMAPGNFWAMACPHCGYCNTIQGFHLAHRKVRSG